MCCKRGGSLCVERVSSKNFPDGLGKVSTFFIYQIEANISRYVSLSELSKLSLLYFPFLDPYFTYCLPTPLFSKKILLEEY